MTSTAPIKRVGAKQRGKLAGPLSPERAFVVQLEADGSGPGRSLAGRVEHLESGEARRFASIEDLSAFMARFPVRRRLDLGSMAPVGRGGRKPASRRQGDV